MSLGRSAIPIPALRWSSAGAAPIPTGTPAANIAMRRAQARIDSAPAAVAVMDDTPRAIGAITLTRPTATITPDDRPTATIEVLP